MRFAVMRIFAGMILALIAVAGRPASAADTAAYFNTEEAASIAAAGNIGLLKSVTVTGKGSVHAVTNFDEVEAFAIREAREVLPKMRFLNCGAPQAERDPAGNRMPIDCDTVVEDELSIAFQVWTVGEKKYPIAYHLTATVTKSVVGQSGAPELVVGAAKLGYTKPNRVQGIVEDYIRDFLNHFALQRALANSGQ